MSRLLIIAVFSIISFSGVAVAQKTIPLVQQVVEAAGGQDNLLHRFTIQERLNVSDDPGKPGILANLSLMDTKTGGFAAEKELGSKRKTSRPQNWFGYGHLKLSLNLKQVSNQLQTSRKTVNPWRD